MLVKKFLKLSLKYSKRKTSIGITIIILVSAILMMIVVGNVFFRTSSQEYVEGRIWPADIYVSPGGQNITESAFEIQAHLGEVDGVKWFVFPGTGIEFQRIYYNWGNYERNYLITLMWCNVEDPVFPHPKFLYEGRFFASNYENSVIIDSATKKLLEYTGKFNGLGENKTVWNILGINMSVIGVISSPALYGNENHTLYMTDVLYIYVPLYTYKMLFNISKQLMRQPQYRDVISWIPDFYVRVKEGYSIEKVANNIKNRFPNAGVITVEEYRESQYNRVVAPQINNSIILFGLVGVIMIWELRYRKKEIFLLEAIGWRRKDIILLFTIRSLLLGVISSIAGLFVMLLYYKLLNFLNAYIVWFIITLTPLTMIFVILGTIIFSFPTILILYKLNIESILRE